MEILAVDSSVSEIAFNGMSNRWTYIASKPTLYIIGPKMQQIERNLISSHDICARNYGTEVSG